MIRRVAAFVALSLLAGLASAASKEQEVEKYLGELKSKDAKVRATAATELGKIGSVKASLTKKAIKPMVEHLSDGDASVRMAVAASICKLDDPKTVVPAMHEQLKAEKEDRVKVALIEGLAIMGSESKEVLPTLKELREKAKDPSMLRTACGRAMQQIRSKE